MLDRDRRRRVVRERPGQGQRRVVHLGGDVLDGLDDGLRLNPLPHRLRVAPEFELADGGVPGVVGHAPEVGALRPVGGNALLPDLLVDHGAVEGLEHRAGGRLERAAPAEGVGVAVREQIAGVAGVLQIREVGTHAKRHAVPRVVVVLVGDHLRLGDLDRLVEVVADVEVLSPARRLVIPDREGRSRAVERLLRVRKRDAARALDRVAVGLRRRAVLGQQHALDGSRLRARHGVREDAFEVDAVVFGHERRAVVVFDAGRGVRVGERPDARRDFADPRVRAFRHAGPVEDDRDRLVRLVRPGERPRAGGENRRDGRRRLGRLAFRLGLQRRDRAVEFGLAKLAIPLAAFGKDEELPRIVRVSAVQREPVVSARRVRLRQLHQTGVRCDVAARKRDGIVSAAEYL